MTAEEYTLYSVTAATNFPPGIWTGSGNTPHLIVQRYYSSTAVRQILSKRSSPNDIWSRTSSSATSWTVWYSYENTTELQLALETANGVNPRIDRVVLRWSAVDRNIQLAVKTGAAAPTPSAPVLTRTGNVYELGLADISVGRGVAAIVANDITDTRLNTSLCGTVSSLIGAVYE